MPNLDLDLVRHALQVARQHGFAEVELGLGESSFTAKLEPKKKGKKPSSAVKVKEIPIEVDGFIEVKANLVGFYRHPKNRVEIGSKVEKGEVVAVVAALGIANDIEAPESGTVEEVLVSDNQPIEYGQVLMRLRA